MSSDMMDKILPRDAEHLPFCIKYILKNPSNNGVVDADRLQIISLVYQLIKTTKTIKSGAYSEIVRAVNDSFRNPLTIDELKKTINELLASGNIVKPTCQDILKNASLKHICELYGSACTVNKKSKLELIKEQMHEIVSSIVPNTKSVQMLVGDPTYYIIEFKDGKQFFIIDEEIIQSPKEFKKWYANTYRRVIEISKSEWIFIVQSWLDMATESAPEQLTEDEAIRELVLNKLRNSVNVSKLEETLMREGRIYIEGDNAYVYNDHLIKMLERANKKITYHKLRLILYHYLSRPTEQIWINANRHRFWVFSVSKVGIKAQPPISDYDNRDEEGGEQQKEETKSGDEHTTEEQTNIVEDENPETVIVESDDEEISDDRNNQEDDIKFSSDEEERWNDYD